MKTIFCSNLKYLSVKQSLYLVCYLNSLASVNGLQKYFLIEEFAFYISFTNYFLHHGRYINFVFSALYSNLTFCLCETHIKWGS